MATAPTSSGGYLPIEPFAKLYIHRNKAYLNAELEVTSAMVDLFVERQVFAEEKIGNIQACFAKHADSSLPCRDVNTVVVQYAATLIDKKVDQFLLCVEKSQPEITWRILGGKLEELIKGKLCAGAIPSTLQDSGGSGELSLSGSAASAGVDYDKYPEPDEEFDDSALYSSIADSPQEQLADIVIGPAGGNFCDVYGDGVEVTVPSGALSSAKTVSVKTMTDRGRWHEDDTIYIGQALEFAEHDLKFAKPVEVKVVDMELFKNSKVADLRINVFASNMPTDVLPVFHDVTEICQPRLDIGKNTVIFHINHFSYYVYTLAQLAVTAWSVASLLGNKEVRIEVGAKPFDEDCPTKLLLSVISSSAGKNKEHKRDYYPVSVLHRKLMVAFFEESIRLSLEPCSGDSLEWQLKSMSQDRLEQGIYPDDQLQPIVLEPCDRNAKPFKPFSAVFTVNSYFPQDVVVEFDIDKEGLARAARQQVRTTLIDEEHKHPPPIKCPGPHPGVHRRSRMTQERRDALQSAMDQLMRDTHFTTIEAMLPDLVRCEILTMGASVYGEIKGGDGRGDSKRRMATMIEWVCTRHNLAFDCFVHSIKHTFHREEIARQILQKEREAISRNMEKK